MTGSGNVSDGAPWGAPTGSAGWRDHATVSDTVTLDGSRRENQVTPSRTISGSCPSPKPRRVPWRRSVLLGQAQDPGGLIGSWSEAGSPDLQAIALLRHMVNFSVGQVVARWKDCTGRRGTPVAETQPDDGWIRPPAVRIDNGGHRLRESARPGPTSGRSIGRPSGASFSSER